MNLQLGDRNEKTDPIQYGRCNNRSAIKQKKKWACNITWREARLTF